MKSSIHLFPLSLPDEIHLSQIGRWHRASGNASTRETYLDLYGTSPFRLSHWLPAKIEEFAHKLPGNAAENLKNLLLRNTLYPLFATFGYAKLIFDANAVPINEQIARMPKRVVGKNGETSLCIQCLRRDRNEHETAYIHRSHQIPGVSVCWEHGTRLLSACPFCGCPFELTADLVLSPWKPCITCNQSLPDATFYHSSTNCTEQEWGFAKFAHDLLQASTKSFDTDTLARIYSDRISAKNLSRRSTIDRTNLILALEAHFGTAFLSQVDSAYQNGQRQNWLRCCSKSGFLDAPISRHLLLANFLFGTSEVFLEKAENSSALPVETTNQLLTNQVVTAKIRRTEQKPLSLPIVAITQTESKVSIAKQKVSAFIAENPHATKGSLWKHLPGAMKQLHKQGTDHQKWLAGELESTAASTGTASKEKWEDCTAADFSWAQKFSAAALALYSSPEKPIKVTRNRLMQDAQWKTGNIPNKERYPLARQQLDSLCESNWHYYARRIIWAKLTVGTRATSASSVIIPAGIEHHRGVALNEFFGNLQKNRALGYGTISEILNEYQIQKSWNGPTPDQDFYTPGRNYQHRQRAINRPSLKEAPVA